MCEGYSDLEDRSTRPCGPGLGRRLLEHSRDRRHRRWSCRDLPMQRWKLNSSLYIRPKLTYAGGVVAGPVVWAGVVLQGGALTTRASRHSVSFTHKDDIQMFHDKKGLYKLIKVCSSWTVHKLEHFFLSLYSKNDPFYHMFLISVAETVRY